MARKVKLMGGCIFYKGKQYRCIVLATSQKQAAEITGESTARIRDYWCETHNPVELEVAQEAPAGSMWISPLNKREKSAYIKLK